MNQIFTLEYAKTVGVNSLIMYGVNMLGIIDQVDRFLERTPITNLLIGAPVAVAFQAGREAANMIEFGSSNLQQGNWLVILDDMTYNAIVFSIFSSLRLDEQIDNFVGQILGETLSNDFIEAISLGMAISITGLIRQALPGWMAKAEYITNPVSTAYKMVSTGAKAATGLM